MENKNRIVKVCGMTRSDNIKDVEDLGIDMMGFIFYEKSKRFVSIKPDYLPVKAKRVGVFVNSKIEDVCKTAAEYNLDYIQLHGGESPEYCRILNEKKYKLIKAFPISVKDDFNKTQYYESVCKYFLFDTKSKQYGGSGLSFDWNILQSYTGSIPFLLSGGIGIDNLDALKTITHKQYAGIDLNSRFEIEPGLKDIKQLNIFLIKNNR